jgi:hypothetical protein
MRNQQPDPSRRNVLRALAAAPLLAGLPAHTPKPPGTPEPPVHATPPSAGRSHAHLIGVL